MKKFSACLALVIGVPLQSLQAAYQTFPIQTRQLIIDDGIRHYDVSRPVQVFRVELLNDSGETKGETYRDGHPFVTAQPGERYTIRLYNPLPIRVAVNLTVDGLNSIT